VSQRYEKLKTLLKELFQLDQPDLDFGFYRVMHARSAEVTQFLEKDLLPQVRAAFAQYQPADKAALEKELAKAIEQARALGADPETLPKVRELRAKLADDAVDLDALEAEVYDHLYSFFRRYYSEGDFLSKRVYKPGVYAIPYEGEEVKLHWANADQYYIKTSEYLRDYAFRLRPDDDRNPMRVHLRLVDAAEGEHGNIKEQAGKERRFKLAPAPFAAVEEGELVIRFTYAPDPENRKQKELNAAAEAAILGLNDALLVDWLRVLGAKHVRADGMPSDATRLRVHLDRYTARNTFDYFIHKDLGGFLRRELDFYIKNEIMHLDDVENETAPRVEQYLSKIKVIRKIAGKIITFLAQLEDFQKKLWLKKKFVTETSWCIRLGVVPEAFYPEIAANDAQREEWVRLHAIDELKPTAGSLLEPGKPGYSVPLTAEFLKAHPTLMVDTRRFDAAFTARLLEAIGDLEGQTDGVLFHSENFQALVQAGQRFANAAMAGYYDPPYNTSEETFVYKNLYRRSSWAAMMQDRMVVARALLKDEGALLVAIDDVEIARLRLLLDATFGPDNFLGTVVVQSNPRGRGINSFYATSHDYYLVYGVDASAVTVVDQPLTEEQAEGYRHSDDESHYRLLPFRRSGGLSTPSDRPNSEFPLYFSATIGRIFAVGGERKHPFPGAYTPRTILSLASEGSEVLECSPEDFVRSAPTDTIEIMPVDSDGERRVWRWSDRAKILRAAMAGDFVVQERDRSGQWSVLLKDRIKGGRKPKTVWIDSKYDASSHGTNLLQELLGDRGLFGYPKSIYSTYDALHSIVGTNLSAVVFDAFAGSGTTGHAVINLNREDGGQRKFILVEQADYFDTVLLPRLKKVTFSPEWRNGKPKRLATAEDAERSPRLMKVVRLESYEDTLNNLELRRTEDQQRTLDLQEAQGPDRLKEQYLLRYLLDVETRGSASLLNITAFTDPTAYRLKVKRPGSNESREVNVDLIETFNWLIGLTVEHIAAPQTFSAETERDSEGRLRVKGRLKQGAGGRFWFRTVTGTTRDGRKTLVIWRKRPAGESPEGIEEDNLILDEWFTKQSYSSKDSEFDLIYVNGDNNLENLKAPDDTWKVRLIEGDFFRLMFETEGV